LEIKELRMQTLDRIAWEVLNATADDCENLEQIYRLVSYELIETPDSLTKSIYDYRSIPGAPFLSEVADRVRALVDRGLLRPVMDEEGRPWQAREDLSYVWRAWFEMTPEGRNAWETSEYLVEQE
jgi:hypothetical protein